jgi:hypothetical protein
MPSGPAATLNGRYEEGPPLAFILMLRRASPIRTESAPGLLEGDRTVGGTDRQWLRPVIFRRRFAPLHRETK